MVVKLSDFLSTSFSTFSANDTNNSGVTYPGAVVHTTTLTPGLGIGAGLDFQVETADNNIETGMRLEAVTTDVTAGSEDFDLVIKLMQNGAAANEKFRVTSAGAMVVGANTATIGTAAYFVSNGNLGIGTSSPSDKLQVYGTSSVDFSGRVDSATAGDRPSFRFIHTGGSLTTQSPSAARLGLMSFAGINDAAALTTYAFFDSYLEGVANSTANSNMRFVTMNGGTTAERIFIAGNTNVGINKTNPVASLDVSGTGVFGESTSRIVLSSGMIAGNSGISIDYGTIADTGTIQAESQGTAFRNLALNPSGGNVGIGTTAPAYKLQVNGSFAATTKSFVIDHPTKQDMKLRYGSLEGPENGVYVRGKIEGVSIIELPEYWWNLVNENSITVNLTPYGRSQDIWVQSTSTHFIHLNQPADCFFTVFAERKDVDKLVVEF